MSHRPRVTGDSSQFRKVVVVSFEYDSRKRFRNFHNHLTPTEDRHLKVYDFWYELHGRRKIARSGHLDASGRPALHSKRAGPIPAFLLERVLSIKVDPKERT